MPSPAWQTSALDLFPYLQKCNLASVSAMRTSGNEGISQREKIMKTDVNEN